MTRSDRPAADIKPSTAIAILGMHRSGTSALAGTLKESGVYLGRVLDTGIALNPKGLQEPAAVLYMHENLLEANGGRWHEPPDKVVWQPLHRAVRDLFIESRMDVPLWGFKDPRTLLVLDGWLQVLPGLQCVGTFRHPAEVAASIHQRNGFSLEKCFGLWETYNRQLLAWQQRLQFPVIEFVADPQVMDRAYRGAVARLGLADRQSSDFFEASHRHHDVSAAQAPQSSLQLLDALRSVAVVHGT